MAEFQSFFSSLCSTILRRNGLVLSQLLTLPFDGQDGKWTPQMRSALDRVQLIDITSQCAAQIKDQNLAAYVANSLLAINHVRLRNFESAHKNQIAAFNAISEFFCNKDESTNWILAAFARSGDDLRKCAQKADEVNDDCNYKLLRESLNQVTRTFTSVSRDRTPISQPQSKKLALFTLTNLLFKIYFRVNTMQLCSKLIGVIEGPNGVMDSLRSFPVSDVVMYKYYIGRIRMFEDRFDEARAALRFAFQHTPTAQLRDRQRILALLVPIEMSMGIMPSRLLGSRYGLVEYVSLAQAITRGDVASFDALMTAHRVCFVQLGVYMVLELARGIALRNLFRRVHALGGQQTRLSIPLFESVFEGQGLALSLDEIECFLCNLIYQGRVKGYISHEKRTLVVSKNDAFPSAAVIRPFVADK